MSSTLNWQWPADLKVAVDYLQLGGVLAYPTEAIFGIGGNPDNQQAIDKILHLKQGRLPEKGMVLVAANWALCEGFMAPLSGKDTDEMQMLNAKRATTFIVEAGKRARDALKDRQTKRIAIRITSHPVAAGLSNALGCPLISTSANLSSYPPAKTLEEVRHYFPDIAILGDELGNEVRPSRIIDWHSKAVLRV